MKKTEAYGFIGSAKVQYFFVPALSALIPMIRVERPPRTNSQRSPNVEVMNLSFLNKNRTRLRTKKEVDDITMRYKEVSRVWVRPQYPTGIANRKRIFNFRVEDTSPLLTLESGSHNEIPQCCCSVEVSLAIFQAYFELKTHLP
jgi:hypothetical protein